MDRFKKQRVMKRVFAIVTTDAIVLAACEKDEELEHIHRLHLLRECTQRA